MVPLSPFCVRAVRLISTGYGIVKARGWLIVGVVYSFVFYNRPTLCA
jgi:hypothetical protein